MVYLSHQFRGLLTKVLLALVLVAALPSSERRHFNSGSKYKPQTAHDGSYGVAKLDGGGGEVVQALGQRDAAGDELPAPSHGSPTLAHNAGLSTSPSHSGAALEIGSGTQQGNHKRYHSHHHGGHHQREHWHVGGAILSGYDRSVAVDDSVVASRNHNHFRVHSRNSRNNQAEVDAAVREAIGSISDGGTDRTRVHGRHYPTTSGPSGNTTPNRKHPYPPKRHHRDRPNDGSKGGHSVHWYKHHHLELGQPHSHNHHHHHHHSRMASVGPRRLSEYEDEDEEKDETDSSFIAPPSVQVKPGTRAKSVNMGNLTTMPVLSRMVTIPKAASPTGLYRAVRPIGANIDSDGVRGSNLNEQVEGGSPVKRRSFRKEVTPLVLAAVSPPTAQDSFADNILGIIELLSNVNGTRIGTLSVSPAPDHPFDAYPNNATAPAYIIDATTKPTESTKFYLWKYNNQTLLDTSPGPKARLDQLVSLEAQHDFDGGASLCAAFGSRAEDVQVFRLAVCSYLPVVVNGSANQAWRYSPGTGVVRPFYGVNEKPPKTNRVDQPADMNDLFDRDEVDYLDALDFGYSSFSNNSNMTNTSPVLFSSPDALQRPSCALGTMLNSTTNTTCVSDNSFGPPSLSLQSPLDPAHTLIIGHPDFMATKDQPIAKNEGVTMVFRRVYATVKSAGAKAWSEPKLMDAPDSDRFSQSNQMLEARKAPLPLGHTGFDSGRSEGETEYSQTDGAVGQIAPDELNNYVADLDDAKEEDTVPKPVINVSYFGDSGRSPPVPPESQAPSAKAILMAVASKDKSPVELVSLGGERDGVIPVYFLGPGAKVRPAERMASILQVDGEGLSVDKHV